ncbi:MAG: hypothetical protein IT209_03490 [Armatimonadetes bacterium]|nr:hypothetical protein [Armatimonadota bacterium]
MAIPASAVASFARASQVDATGTLGTTPDPERQIGGATAVIGMTRTTPTPPGPEKRTAGQETLSRSHIT